MSGLSCACLGRPPAWWCFACCPQNTTAALIMTQLTTSVTTTNITLTLATSLPPVPTPVPESCENRNSCVCCVNTRTVNTTCFAIDRKDKSSYCPNHSTVSGCHVVRVRFLLGANCYPDDIQFYS
ncbi:Sialomucin core protein 24 [Tupaia chinensis]|uniref:Sialomucin core protein 24 n=1 Tax=Tupaia chinensis TaxID=246437 RepID=L9KS03_TUPCH|nr:Sialomucin core protein 24 [Tupaia chinensis]